MERVQIKGSSVMCSGSAAERANLEEEVAGDGRRAMCGVGIDHKRHRKGSKEESTKKSKGAMCGVGVGVDHKGHRKAYKKEERTKKPKGDVVMEPNGDEVMEEMLVADAGSKERGGKMRRKKKRVVAWRLSQELLEYLRTKEVMGFIATDMPRPLRRNVSAEMFDQKLKEEIAAEVKENREFDAYVLFQYRTKGYAVIQEVVSDEEEM